MALVIRPTIVGDFEAFKAEAPPYRVKAWTAELDGEIIGIGGLAFPPRLPPIAFTEIGDAARKHPVALHKTGKRFMAEVKAMGIPKIVATTDASNETARRWLERLGFVEAGEADGKRVHTWAS